MTFVGRDGAVDARQSDNFTADLDAMASDPEIQHELVVIECESQATDGGGLDLSP